MATPEGYTVLVFITIAIQNSLLLIIDSREFNQRKRQLQRERHLKIFANIYTCICLHRAVDILENFVEKCHHLINRSIPIDAPRAHPVCIVFKFSYRSYCNLPRPQSLAITGGYLS